MIDYKKIHDWSIGGGYRTFTINGHADGKVYIHLYDGDTCSECLNSDEFAAIDNIQTMLKEKKFKQDRQAYEELKAQFGAWEDEKLAEARSDAADILYEIKMARGEV